MTPPYGAIVVAWATWVYFPCVYQPQCTANEPGWSDSRRLGSPRPPKFVSGRRVSSRHTRDALLLDVVEIKAYLTGATSGGKGPSFADRARKQHEAEVRKAKSTGKEMFSSPDGLLIDAGSSHKPPSRKKKVSKSKVPAPSPRGGTPLYRLNRYVQPQRVWFYGGVGPK